jgi:alpha-galactosidase
MARAVALLACASFPVAVAAALSTTPPMGWNPYNHYGCGSTEVEIREQTTALLNLGLHKSGFTFINLDCGWAARNRSAQGRIMAEPKRFPNGVKPLADWVHSQGLLFGICESAMRCAASWRALLLG